MFGGFADLHFSFQIFDLLPLKKSSGIPYEVDDATDCLNVRPKRYVLPHPSQEQNDAYAVFQVKYKYTCESVKLNLNTIVFVVAPVFADLCVLLKYVESRTEDGDKLAFSIAFMRQVKRKSLP